MSVLKALGRNSLKEWNICTVVSKEKFPKVWMNMSGEFRENLFKSWMNVSGALRRTSLKDG